MKTWLKGGLWGAGIYVTISLFLFLLVIFGVFGDAEFLFIIFPVSMFMSLVVGYGLLERDPSLIFLFIFKGFTPLAVCVLIIFNIIIFFVLGSLIGWIISKIRNK